MHRQPAAVEEAVLPRAGHGKEPDLAASQALTPTPSTTALARSSHGRSSTTTSTGPAPEAWTSSASTALDNIS